MSPDRSSLLRHSQRVYGPAMVLSNVVGAGVIFVFLVYLLPVAPENLDRVAQQNRVNTIAFVLCILLSLVIGNAWGRRLAAPVTAWLEGDRAAGDLERQAALRLPLRQARVHGVLWFSAAVAFGALNLDYSVTVAGQVSGTIVLGGFTTCALGYLVAERTLRPVVGAVMTGTAQPPQRILGVQARILSAWGLGTGVPLLGVALSVVPHAGQPPLPLPAQLFLMGVAGVVGVLSMAAAAGAISDPVRSVAGALREVGGGHLEVTVPVYDASEIGQLQSGFNAMVGGLRERERLHDLYGRQVGRAVAQLAVDQGVRLGGERRDVAVLFVDVVGSTGLTELLGPDEVVARLNAFFAVVVEVVSRYGGWVNKFQGDATLCVFGAPVELPDSVDAALAAARELARRLAPLSLDAGIGLGAGPVVAGHVGTESRFEYTVVGGPVNTAARLSELAKAEPHRVLADAAAVRASGLQEQTHWVAAGSVLLRGRQEPTSLARLA